MTFNLQKFSVDVKEYRKSQNLTQKEFASKLELDNHTLISLFEQGKRAPSKDVFANYCQITNHRSEEYWNTNDSKPNKDTGKELPQAGINIALLNTLKVSVIIAAVVAALLLVKCLRTRECKNEK